MTLSEIRRRVDALKRRFARELAIIELRRVAEAVANDWDPDQPAEPAAVIQLIVKAGFRLPTFVRLRRCLDHARRRGEVPDAESMVLALLPWADNHRYSELLRWDLPPQPSRPPLYLF